MRITGTYTTPTWNKKKHNFRPHFPVDSGFQIFPQEAVQDFSAGKNQKKIKKLLHSQNFESPKIHKLIQISRSEAPGILARRIRLFVGGFPPKTESVFFKSFRFGMAVHEHKPTWQKKPSSQLSLDGQDWIPKESNSNHHQNAF